MTSRGTVYLVDDDQSVRKSVSRLFRNAGYQVKAFESANEFLDFDCGSEAACLILDINMPGLSGIELQQRLNERHSALPVVFMSGHGDIPISVRTMKAGAVDFLPKPVDQDVLISTASALALSYRRGSRTFMQPD